MRRAALKKWLVGGLILMFGLAAGCAPNLAPAAVRPSLAAVTPTPRRTPTAAPTHFPSPTPTPACSLSTGGRLEQASLPSERIGKPLEYWVYLPPCYTETPAQPYPWLMLLHGQSMDAQVWVRMGVQARADELIAGGKAPPFVIILPTEAYYLQDMSEARFGEAVRQELLPAVQARYPLCAQPECRAVGGLSRGALWALRLALEGEPAFGAVGGHSLPNSPFSPSKLRALLAARSPQLPPRIWLDSGDLDRYLRGAKQFHELLTQLNVAHTWTVNEGAHEEAYWQAHLGEYLQWYAQDWPIP